MVTSKGLPPIPHPFWVSRAGFQQNDPVTDFRSGGVLSLAMLLHIVESAPHVHVRFVRNLGGDASVLPLGITSINVTDMLAKLLMFSKSVDKIDALLSSKPFWRMFSDPNALLVLQELAMDMLCDVVVELGKEKKLEHLEEIKHNSKNAEEYRGVTVFDFPFILERTEKRVRDDLLGSAPKTVEEMKSIAGRLKVKYMKASDRYERVAMKKLQSNDTEDFMEMGELITESVKEGALGAMTAMNVAVNSVAGQAGGFWGKFKDKVGKSHLNGKGNGIGMANSGKTSTLGKWPHDANTHGADICNPQTNSVENSDAALGGKDADLMQF
mmetsp:Transcript_14866/g.21955  ORF Transcript_14866/g.21955 Transcript_14866/m.21955 type:complete len:326 (+) Transcript_14866:1-978(+)